MTKQENKYTIVGTDIEAVKEQARKSGLSYNEVKEWIAKTTGGHDTKKYSDTDITAIKSQNEQSEQNKRE